MVLPSVTPLLSCAVQENRAYCEKMECPRKRSLENVPCGTMTKLAKVQARPFAPPPGQFSAAFVLPITRDGRALLTIERRGKEEKYGLLGGKAQPKEDVYACMAREANEESGGALSNTTLLRLGRGAGALGDTLPFVVGNNPPESASIGVRHDLVVKADLDVDTQFEASKAAAMRTHAPERTKKKKKSPPTVQTGLKFVSVETLKDFKWREANMHFTASVLCARLLKQ